MVALVNAELKCNEFLQKGHDLQIDDGHQTVEDLGRDARTQFY
jgi:hypothetical protein